jgi:hypothetical protein
VRCGILAALPVLVVLSFNHKNPGCEPLNCRKTTAFQKVTALFESERFQASPLLRLRIEK